MSDKKEPGAIDWQPTLESIGQRVAAQRRRGFEDTSAQASVDRRVLWDSMRVLIDTLEESIRHADPR